MAESEFAQPWRKLLGKKPDKDSKGRHLYDEKCNLLHRLPERLSAGEYGASFTRDELDRFLAAIKEKVPARIYAYLVRFLDRGLRAGKQDLEWDVALPSIPITISREPSRFTPPKFIALQRLRLIETRFLNTLQEFDEMTTSQRLGKLLLSAILFGGLLQKQWLTAWLEAFSERIRINGSNLWLEMEITWQPQRDKRENVGGDTKSRSAQEAIIVKRRWFSDPLTKALISRWLKLPQEKRVIPEHPANPYDYIRIYFNHIGISPEEIPKSVKEFIEMAETRLGLTVSSFLVSYATGKIEGVSVPAETWTRLLSGKAVPRVSATPCRDYFDDTSKMPDHGVPPKKKKRASPSEQEVMLRQVRRIVSGKKGKIKSYSDITKELSSFLKEHDREICSIIRHLTEWAIALLSKKGRNKPSTVDRYLTAIGSHLLVVCENDEILSFEPSEFEECYNKVVELVKSKKEKNFVWTPLSIFHDYLVTRHKVPMLHKGIFARKSSPPEISVDANLVSQADFDRIKSVLGWENANRPRTATVGLLTAILGFRCGLRRNEARFLRIRDIQGRHRPELILRTTSRRRLKSLSSTRRLPLYVLLPHDELKLLMGWVEQHEKGGPEALLFSIRGRKNWAFKESTIYLPITKALSQVTGDTALKYHHLRHSFGTWLLVRLTGAGTGLMEVAPFLHHPEFSDERIAELRVVLHGNEHLGRKGAYVVSSLLGHADLETTFESYVHLCDWLLGRELSQSDSQVIHNVDGLCAVSGVSRATVCRLMSKMNDSSICNNLERLFLRSMGSDKQCRDPHLAAAKDPAQEPVCFEDEFIDLLFWNTVQEALTLYQVKRAGIEEIASKLGFDPIEVESWIKNAERLAWMKTRDGNNTKEKALETPKTKKAEKKQDAQKNRKQLKEQFFSSRCFRHHDIKSPCPETEMMVFPTAPTAEDDRLQAGQFLDRFCRLDPERQRAVLSAVDYFTEFYIRLENMLVFSEPGKARRYIDAARAIGVKKDMFRMVEFPNFGKPGGDEDKQKLRLWWEKELNLSGCRWKKRKKSFGSRDGSVSIGVQVTGRIKGKEFESGYSKNGFLYALYMIEIARFSFARQVAEISQSEDTVEGEVQNSEAE